MAKASGRRKYYLLIVLAVLLADRFTKLAVARAIALHDSLTVIPGLFHLTHVQNRGAAFGLFDDSPSEWKIAMLVVFSVAALILIAALLWKNGVAMNAMGVGLALVMGGALGNLWDRVVSRHVTDFLDFNLGRYHWPAFNVADSAIVVGAFLLVVDIVLLQRPEREKKA
jgi:signal peptidase II